MADPYWRYGVPGDRAAADGIPRPSFPGYIPSDVPSLSSHQPWSSNDLLRGASSDYLQKDALPYRPGAYGVGDIAGIGSWSTPGLGGLTAGANMMGYPPPLDDPTLISQRRDVTPGIKTGIPDILSERPTSLRTADSLSLKESNMLFVDGLPTDCSRREVAHLFRPFVGFKEIRVVHKESRRSGDKAMVLCFVEFSDAKCALTAMEALQGYKFDHKKPDAPVLKIHFAHFPFHLPSDRDEPPRGGPL